MFSSVLSILHLYCHWSGSVAGTDYISGCRHTPWQRPSLPLCLSLHSSVYRLSHLAAARETLTVYQSRVNPPTSPPSVCSAGGCCGGRCGDSDGLDMYLTPQSIIAARGWCQAAAKYECDGCDARETVARHIFVIVILATSCVSEELGAYFVFQLQAVGIFTPYRDFFRVSLLSLCLKTFRGVATLEVSRYLTSVKLAAKSKQRTAEYSGPSNWLTKLTLDSLGSLGSTGSLLALPWLVLSSPLTHSWLTSTHSWLTWITWLTLCPFLAHSWLT